MKAKDLAEKLLLNPEAEVLVGDEDEYSVHEISHVTLSSTERDEIVIHVI